MKKIQQIEDTEKHLVESKLEKFFFFFLSWAMNMKLDG